jgi:hypothetical protein
MGDPATVDSDDVPALHVPSDGDRELLRVWLVGAGGELGAYVNRRHNDDPAVIGRIVITKREGRQPLYWVQCPSGANIWTVTSVGERSVIGEFPTLRAALDCIRPTPPSVQATVKSNL